MTTEKDDSFVFSLPQNPIPSKLQNYRLKCKFTDITLKVGEEKFTAHRMILDDASPVFKALLSENWSNKSEYELSDRFVDSQIMEDLLTYFYTAQLTLTPGNAHSICIASHYLHIPVLLTASEKYLSEKVTSGNVLDLLLLSDKLELKVLLQKSVNFLVKNSEILSKDSKLMSFALEDMQMTFKELGKQKNIAKLKEVMFESSMKWVDNDYLARSPYLPTLLKSIPLSDLSSKFLNEVVAKQSQIRDSHACSSLLIDALSKTSTTCSESVPETVKTLGQIFCFGGMDEKFNTRLTISKLDISTGKWSLVSKMRSLRTEYTGAAVANKIFIIGGEICEEKQSSMEMFDCQSGTWKNMAPMPQARSGCAAAVLRGFIYVSGGSNPGATQPGHMVTTMSSMIRYNVSTNKWTKVRAMSEPRAHHQLVAVNDKLYAVGGYPTNHTVEQYNPDTDRWTKMSFTTGNYVACNATEHNGQIWIRNWQGFEVYTPETDTWKMLPVKSDHHADRLVSMNGQLWAIAGLDNDGTQEAYKTVLVFDTDKNTWKRQPDMDFRRLTPYVFGVAG